MQSLAAILKLDNSVQSNRKQQQLDRHLFAFEDRFWLLPCWSLVLEPAMSVGGMLMMCRQQIGHPHLLHKHSQRSQRT